MSAVPLTQDESLLEVDDRIETADNKRGTVKYIGEVPELGQGFWAGVSLDDPVANGNGNDGSVQGTRYFDVNSGHGTFIPYDSATKITDSILPQHYNNYYTDPSNSANSEFEQTKNRLSRKFQRRPSAKELEKRGVIPQNYFKDPQSAGRRRRLTQEMAAFHLQEFLQERPNPEDLEETGIVPDHYWEDPHGTQHRKNLVRDMVSSELSGFVNSRPSKLEMAQRNIMPAEFAETDDNEEALQRYHERQRSVENNLKEKLHPRRRPTITDLGEMHIIPYKYLDDLLEEATTHHQRVESRMEHMTDRLKSHLPQPVAEALAESLMSNIQTDDNPNGNSNGNNDENDNGDNNNSDEYVNGYHPHNIRDDTIQEEINSRSRESGDDDEDNENNTLSNRQSNIINNLENRDNYIGDSHDEIDENDEENGENFVPLNPNETKEVKRRLSHHLGRRPSHEQIEVWGFVPPDYFDNPEKSVMAQTIGREMATEVLEQFFPQRPEIHRLANSGVVHPDYITKDYEEARAAQNRRKSAMKEHLNDRLNKEKRPSMLQMAENGYIPESWLLDLYGLADVVRKKHQRMESAVADLEKQLNVPAVLATAVATDILEEIETVDPHLKMSSNSKPRSQQQINQNDQQQYVDDLHSQTHNIGNRQRQEQIEQQQQQEEDGGDFHRGNRDSIDLQPQIDVDALREEIEREVSIRLQSQFDEHAKAAMEQMAKNRDDYIKNLKIQLETKHKNDNTQLLNKIEQLTNELNIKGNELNDSQTEIMKITQINSSLKNENDALNRNVESIKQFEKQYKNKIDELEKELSNQNNLSNTVNNLQSTVTQLTNDKMKLSLNCAEEINKLRQYIVALEKRNTENMNNSSWSFGLFG